MRTGSFLPFFVLAAVIVSASACTKDDLQPNGTAAPEPAVGRAKTLNRPFLMAAQQLPDPATQVEFEVLEVNSCSVIGYLYAVRPPNTGIGTPYSTVDYIAYNPGSDFTAADVLGNTVTFGLCGTYLVRPTYPTSGAQDQLKVEFQDTGCGGNTFDPTIAPSTTPLWRFRGPGWQVGNQTPSPWVWSSATYGFASSTQTVPYSTCP